MARLMLPDVKLDSVPRKAASNNLKNLVIGKRNKRIKPVGCKYLAGFRQTEKQKESRQQRAETRKKEKNRSLGLTEGFLSEELHWAFVAGESGRVYGGKPTEILTKTPN